MQMLHNIYTCDSSPWRLDRNNKRRGIPAAHHGIRDGGQVDRRLHNTPTLPLPARAEVYPFSRLGTARV